MPVFLHGLVPPDTHPQKAPDHRLIDCGQFSALISPVPDDVAALPPEQLAQLAIHHNAVLVAYCTTSSVLPLRFGAAFSTAEAARTHLQSQSQFHLRALTAVAGLREYTLRLTVTDDPVLPERRPTTGRDFLTRGRDLRDRRKMLADGRIKLVRDLREGLRPICHHVESAGTPKPDRLVDLALLIDGDQVPALTRLVAEVAPQAGPMGLDLRFTGPWPAYSFNLEGAVHGA